MMAFDASRTGQSSRSAARHPGSAFAKQMTCPGTESNFSAMPFFGRTRVSTYSDWPTIAAADGENSSPARLRNSMEFGPS